jgi:hypothetical protein
MKTGNSINLLGFPLITRILIQDKERTVWTIIICRLLKISLGYSIVAGDSIQISIGVTKLEIFTSFTIKKGWFT